MKQIPNLLILTLVLVIFSSCAAPEEKATSAIASATATASPTENVEQIVAKLERDWADAIVKGDVATIDRILADDFNYTNWDGTTTTKAQHVEDIKSKAYKAESINLENLKVRVFGDAAVVTVGQVEKNQFKGKNNSGHYRIFTRREMVNGRSWPAMVARLRHKKRNRNDSALFVPATGNTFFLLHRP
jgi:ketosteroid isomerase-like protein